MKSLLKQTFDKSFMIFAVLAVVSGSLARDADDVLFASGAILFAIVWIVMVGRAPKVQDSPQPDPTNAD